jgi:hypothetical protein
MDDIAIKLVTAGVEVPIAFKKARETCETIKRTCAIEHPKIAFGESEAVPCP